MLEKPLSLSSFSQDLHETFYWAFLHPSHIKNRTEVTLSICGPDMIVGWETGTNQSVSHPTIIPGPQKLSNLCSILLFKEADLIPGLSTKVTISTCKIVNCKTSNFNTTHQNFGKQM